MDHRKGSMKRKRRARSITLAYDLQMRERWKKGNLCQEWANQYKDRLVGVCERDLSNAHCQPKFHFGEWFAALHYIQKGWKVLLPKYTHARRPERQRITREIVRPAGFRFLTCKRKLPDKRGIGLVLRKSPKPDLLVYKKPGEFFFVEVKRDGDRLSYAQRAFFPMIEQTLGCRVVIASVKAQRRVRDLRA